MRPPGRTAPNPSGTQLSPSDIGRPALRSPMCARGQSSSGVPVGGVCSGTIPNCTSGTMVVPEQPMAYRMQAGGHVRKGTIAFRSAGRRCAQWDNSELHQWDQGVPECQWPTCMQVAGVRRGTIAFRSASRRCVQGDNRLPEAGRGCVQWDNSELHQWDQGVPECQWPTCMQVAGVRRGTIAIRSAGPGCVQWDNSELHQWDQGVLECQWPTCMQVGDVCKGTVAFRRVGRRWVQWDNCLPERRSALARWAQSASGGIEARSRPGQLRVGMRVGALGRGDRVSGPWLTRGVRAHGAPSRARQCTAAHPPASRAGPSTLCRRSGAVSPTGR